MIVCNFDSDSISIIETGNDEVGSSLEIGQHPSRGVVTLDNSRLYVSNFGSNSVAVYDIDSGRRIETLTVGSHPDALPSLPTKTICSWPIPSRGTSPSSRNAGRTARWKHRSTPC